MLADNCRRNADAHARCRLARCIMLTALDQRFHAFRQECEEDRNKQQRDCADQNDGAPAMDFQKATTAQGGGKQSH